MENLMLLLLLAAFFAQAARIRARFHPRTVTLRMKPGESEAEAQATVVWAHRAYCAAFVGEWLTWALIRPLGPLRVTPWFSAGAIALAWFLLHFLFLILTLSLAHAVYWRLGYGGKRIGYVIGHVWLWTALPIFFALHHDMKGLAATASQTDPGWVQE